MKNLVSSTVDVKERSPAGIFHIMYENVMIAYILHGVITVTIWQLSQSLPQHYTALLI